jgi:hypothetical protein
MLGKLASRLGGFVSKVGSLASKVGGSSAIGQLATPLKATIGIGGALLNPFTGGISGKVAGLVNKGISYAADGGLSNLGNKLNAVGQTISSAAAM